MLPLSGQVSAVSAQSSKSTIVGLAIGNAINMIEFFNFNDPNKKFSNEIGGNPNDIKIIGNYAIVAVSNNEIEIY